TFPLIVIRNVVRNNRITHAFNSSIIPQYMLDDAIANFLADEEYGRQIESGQEHYMTAAHAFLSY
ncbi:hypothetical protein GJ496_002146, partial [Pomphorhynchus laevis]